MLKKLLPLLVVVVTTLLVTGTWSSPPVWDQATEDLQQLPKEWPCPDETPSEACICIVDDIDTSISLDCSAATSNAHLAQYFLKLFPITTFKKLLINPVEPATELDTLSGTTFGPVSFKSVEITNTYLRVIEDQAFGNSQDIEIMLLPNNQIESVQFANLGLYNVLRELDLSDNVLLNLPDLASTSIKILRLNGNTGLNILETTFPGCVALEELHLQRMKLSGVAPNFLDDLTKLIFLDLSLNELSGALPSNTINPPLGSLTTILLRDNQLTNIETSAITSKSINYLHTLIYSSFSDCIDKHYININTDTE